MTLTVTPTETRETCTAELEVVTTLAKRQRKA